MIHELYVWRCGRLGRLLAQPPRCEPPAATGSQAEFFAGFFEGKNYGPVLSRLGAAMGIACFAGRAVPLAACFFALFFQTDETAVRTVAQGAEGPLETGFCFHPDETAARAHMPGNREKFFKCVDTQLQMLDFLHEGEVAGLQSQEQIPCLFGLAAFEQISEFCEGSVGNHDKTLVRGEKCWKKRQNPLCCRKEALYMPFRP